MAAFEVLPVTLQQRKISIALKPELAGRTSDAREQGKAQFELQEICNFSKKRLKSREQYDWQLYYLYKTL